MNAVVTSDRNIIIPLDDLIGSFRRFGERGPVYQIVSAAEGAVGTNVELRIRVVESGEELDYPLRDILSDPIAH
jgi:Family of unknown function (DUF5397)